MSKEIYISSTPHETRLAIVENDALTEIYYERENEYTLAGSIYNGKVTRVLPGMQSSFVDIGLERDAFLYITDFMEEAGDSADFEASASGGGGESKRREGGGGGGNRDRGPRNERSDRGERNDRNDRGERSDRGDRNAAPAEPTDADLFASAVSSLDPARPVSEGRGENRGGRGGRDRNRRDRDRGRDAGANPASQDQHKPDAPAASFAETASPAPIQIQAGEDHDGNVGEGAPGADGSRRWRGRRGRRGNRGGAERPATEAATEQQLAPRADTGPVEDAYGTHAAEPEPSFELEGAATEEAAQDFTAATTAQPFDPRERSGRSRRGRGQRGGSSQDGQQRAPRGFTPATSLHQVDGADDTLPTEAPQRAYGEPEYLPEAAEPMILPGESLSKYRGDAPGAAPAETQAPPPPAAFVAEGWDGGSVLPGETIRPRGPVAGGSSERDRGGRDRNSGRDERGGRGDRGGRDRDRGRSRETAAPFTPEPGRIERTEAVAAEAPPVPTYLTAPDDMPASHLTTPVNSTFVAPPPMPMAAPEATVEDFSPAVAAPEELTAEPVEAIAEPAKAEAEFEPTEASASYRVDPAPPSEYRQSAPQTEEPILAEPTHDHAAGDHGAPELKTAAFGEDLDAHSAQPEMTHAAHAEEPQAEAPQFTSIDDAGEMHSDLSAAELPHAETPSPAEPIAHEAAIVSTPQQPAGFAPGDGMLEEEVMEDEEDGEATPALAAVQAHSAEHEPEQLEGVAELNVMLREMSIDNITRSEPESEDEEDFEEDFLEEDHDFSSEEGGSDDFAEEDAEPGDHHEHGEDELGEPGGTFDTEPAHTEHAAGESSQRSEERSGREGKREGRRNDRGRRSGSGERSGSGGGFSNAGSGGGGGRRDHRGGGGRPSMQMTNLPAISDLLKPGQEILCQIAKEPIAKKGARITSHIALPGRFLVFMPTVNHTGVSRKIESDGERRRLKEILLSEKGDASGGFIVRTAASGASEEELRSDLRFLLNLWTDIKTRSESSKSPALIYHDLNLVERVLRDQVTDNFSAIWVDTEQQYESVLRFLQRFQPSLIRRVKLYTKETPLFEQFGITEEINKALRSKVWLKSGGSIVINQTEALVAIDINTGKFVGKTARLEDTIVKTNLDAIPEIVRQIRLRDLGGIIIIDFIDMDERKNRNKVMAALEEELKSDRAPSKVLQFNDFGLVAITRKRVKQSLERTLSSTCNVCAGTGMTKSPVTVCNDIYVEMRKMHKHLDRGDVMLRVNPEVVKQLKAPQTNWLHEMEEMLGKTILVKSDPSLHPEQFDIH